MTNAGGSNSGTSADSHRSHFPRVEPSMSALYLLEAINAEWCFRSFVAQPDHVTGSETKPADGFRVHADPAVPCLLGPARRHVNGQAVFFCGLHGVVLAIAGFVPRRPVGPVDMSWPPTGGNTMSLARHLQCPNEGKDPGSMGKAEQTGQPVGAGLQMGSAPFYYSDCPAICTAASPGCRRAGMLVVRNSPRDISRPSSANVSDQTACRSK